MSCPVLRLARAGRTDSPSRPQPGRPPAMPRVRGGGTHWVTPRRPGAGPESRPQRRDPAQGRAVPGTHPTGWVQAPGGRRGRPGPAPGRVHSHEGRPGVSRRFGELFVDSRQRIPTRPLLGRRPAPRSPESAPHILGSKSRLAVGATHGRASFPSRSGGGRVLA